MNLRYTRSNHWNSCKQSAKRGILFPVIGSGLLVALANAEISYPFELPEKLTASVEVNTKAPTVPVNPMLLGLNVNWPEGQYGKVGYNHPDAQKLIRTIKPSSLRFPHGVWSNFYDWEVDGRRLYDNYVTPYVSSVTNHPDLLYGFDGFHTLHAELDFDVLFTWNVTYDSPEKGAQRLMDRKEKGFQVKWIELGNEIFWKTQRSDAVSTVEQYIEVSKAHTAALKAVDPGVQVSVPIHWRDALSNPWNQPFMTNAYFDAITVHKHVECEETPEGAKEALFVGDVLEEMGQTIRKGFPDHPIWLSEWSVGCGANAISVLGLADAYLTLFEHQDIFEIADYFQLNAKQPLIEYDGQMGIHTKTSFGMAYEMIRDTFENAELLKSEVTSDQIGEGMAAVRATAILNEGAITVFAINKTPLRIPLRLDINGVAQKRTLKHQALSFEDINQLKIFDLEEQPPFETAPHTAGVILPPLSLNMIHIAPKDQP